LHQCVGGKTTQRPDSHLTKKKQRSVGEKIGYCHYNARAFGAIQQTSTKFSLATMPSSCCLKLYLTESTIIASTPLLFGYIDYFSPKSLANSKSCLTILPTHPTIHLQNCNGNEGAKMQQKGSKVQAYRP
jgi:hypothetical protein